MGSRALAIINRVNTIQRKYAPADRTVYKRVITPATGGDPLIGRVGTPTFTDTILDPQPTYSRLARYDVGPGARSQMVQDGSTKQVANQYAFLCSPTALSRSDLDNDLLQLLLVDGAGNKEVFEITDYDEPASMGGVDIIFILYARSIQGP